MITLLDLPQPSNQLKDLILSVANSAPLELDLKKKHDTIQNFTKNSVSRKFIEDNEELNSLACQEFAPLFEEKILPAVGIVKNITGDKFACWPPHSDRVRIFALNYYLQEGGENVETVTYKYLDNHNAGIGTGRIYKYDELEEDERFRLKMESWYALSVRQAHSVENIETTRIIFTLSFHDITYFDFLKKYPQYIKE